MERSVIAQISFGSRAIHVCDTQILATGERVAEIIDYVTNPAPGREPYGAGAIVPLEAIDDVITALQLIKKRHLR
ncbi:hypothetical protein [Nonomuraea sp. SYSU D8015]|uniref:hypothetical protein n=1 Tax=Nonomuraea sp. SYSU D8015 TaxID=2593644 RepID=UPI001660B5FD|nr:hypothetical protein [Nonomuraea sp. SYSU D8015]